MSNPSVSPATEASWTHHPLVRTGLVLGLLYLFLVGVDGLGAGFAALGEGVVDSLFAATANPFMALMVGILSTTLVQSSSATTATIVALVAAPENPLPIVNAVPMIMGANIGTTVTNSIASLAHIGRSEEFKRAFAVATCHDFFNYLVVIVLLPLELLTGFLTRPATALASRMSGLSGAEFGSPIKDAIGAGGVPIEGAINLVIGPNQVATVLYILVSGVLIFVALLGIVRVMRSAMRSRVERLVSRALARNVMVAIAVGIVATVMVQSSSITTSLLVPLAGAGVLKLRQAFPVTLGANIGTTVTALLASMAMTGANAAAGLTIALVHLLFNLTGTLLVYPIPAIREIPLTAARKLADVASRSRVAAILYVVTLFYLLPAVFALLSRGQG